MNKKILFCATVDYHFKAFHLPYLKWFKEQGWEVHVAAAGSLDLPYIDTKYNLPIQRSPFHQLNMMAYKELKAMIKENQYQMIHCHTPMGGVLARLAARSAGKNGTKVIYTAHGFHFCKGAPLLNWIVYYPIERMLSRYTDELITINQEDYQLAKTHRFKAAAVSHVHGVGVNTEQFKPVNLVQKKELRKEYGYDDDLFLLFYAAEFNKNKNQQFLIKALAAIKDKASNLKLLLAGDGLLLEECKKLAETMNVSHLIDFLGFRNDIEKLLKISDLAVASSLREGLPVNIMEAMACGLPVVATINRGHGELIEDGINGYLISPKNERQFSTRIMNIYESVNHRQQMGTANEKKMKVYSISKVIDELIDIYSKYMPEEKNETQSKHHRAYL